MKSNTTNTFTDTKKLIDNMDLAQIGQFLTILSAINLVCLSNNFFSHKNVLFYLNKQFISLGYNYVLFFNCKNQKRVPSLIRALKHSFDRSIPIEFEDSNVLNNHLKSDKQFIEALDNIRAYKLHLFSKKQEIDDVRKLTFELIKKLVEIKIISLQANNPDYYQSALEFRMTILACAEKIVNHDMLTLMIDNGLSSCLNIFVTNLYKNNAHYWAKWFEKIFENNIMITSKFEKELFSLKETQFELNIVDTSIYLLEIGKGTRVFNETRLIILGDEHAGKTCFAKRFENLDAVLSTDKDVIPRIASNLVKISQISPNYDDLDFVINVWYFVGRNTIDHAMHKFFLSQQAVYVIVLKGSVNSSEFTPLDEWLEHIAYYSDGSDDNKIKVYVLVDKSGNISPDTKYNPKYNDKLEIDTSWEINLLKDNEPYGKLDIFRKEIITNIVNSPHEDLPISIADIKNAISEEIRKGVDVASKLDIEKIIKRHAPKLDSGSILRILHSLGICFYYDTLQDGDIIKEVDEIVLNPCWIIYAVDSLIKFINVQTPKVKSWHISENDFGRVFNKNNLYKVSNKQYTFISALAQTFGLAYKEKDSLFFPNCLPEQYPNFSQGLEIDKLNDFIVEIKIETKNVFPVAFPKDIIPALIVKHQKNLDNVEGIPCCSINGAVFKHKSRNKIFKNDIVRAEIKKESNSAIVIYVKTSSQASYEFGTEIIKDLHNTIQNYKLFQHVKPVLRVWYTDTRGRDKVCDIEEILDNHNGVKDFVKPNKWTQLKQFAVKISETLPEWGLELKIKDWISLKIGRGK